MSRKQVTWLLLMISLCSSVGLTLLIWRTSPFDGYPKLNMGVIILFFLALFFTTSSLLGIIALRMHVRWPALAGVAGTNPSPVIAIRQGALFGLAVVIIALLALLQMLDVIFALVTFLLVGLLEGFIQNQE